MENRVGTQVPDETECAKMLKQIEAVTAKIEACSVHLSKEERARTLKMPNGAETIAAMVAQLMRKYKVSLPGISAEDIEADLILAKRLGPMVQALETTLRLAEDGVLEAESEAWYATTAGYTALVRLCGTDAKLAAELKPAMEFFGVGRKRKAKPTETK